MVFYHSRCMNSQKRFPWNSCFFMFFWLMYVSGILWIPELFQIRDPKRKSFRLWKDSAWRHLGSWFTCFGCFAFLMNDKLIHWLSHLPIAFKHALKTDDYHAASASWSCEHSSSSVSQYHFRSKPQQRAGFWEVWGKCFICDKRHRLEQSPFALYCGIDLYMILKSRI
jgi:hypothetical protein